MAASQAHHQRAQRDDDRSVRYLYGSRRTHGHRQNDQAWIQAARRDCGSPRGADLHQVHRTGQNSGSQPGEFREPAEIPGAGQVTLPRTFRDRAAAAVVAMLLPCAAPAAEQWLKLQSSHFELYTTAGEKKGREAVLYFEQVRDFFQRTRGAARAMPGTPVRIIAFRSDKEFEPYRFNAASTAFYLEGYDRDYIVMRSISPEYYPVAVHEFTHLLVKHTGAELPIWFNEGLAELYSTLKPTGKKVMVGEVIQGRFYYLQQHKWLSLEALTSADHNSPYYNERDRAGFFYSESWALVHMLNLSSEYRPQFSKFLNLLASGVTASSAFWQAYAKTIDQVQKDLEGYLRGTHFNAAVFDVKLEKSAEEPDILPATPLESGMVLADLLALTGKQEAAKEAYG